MLTLPQHFLSKPIAALVAITVFSFTVACDKPAPTEANPVAQSAWSIALPANLLVTEQPAGAIGVIEARIAAKTGDSKGKNGDGDECHNVFG